MSEQVDGPGLDRRRVAAGLLGIGVAPLLLVGCSDGEGVDLPGLPDAGEDADEPLLTATLQAEQALLAAVRRTLRRHRLLRPVLQPTIEVHGAHVALLKEGLDDEPAPAPRGGVAPSPGAALTALVRQERRLARTHVAAALQARSGAFARLLAVLAAAAEQQAVTVGTAATEVGGS